MPQFVRNPLTIDNYDPAAELTRVVLPDVVVAGRRLNRGTAVVKVTAPVESVETAAVRKRWEDRLLPTTLDPESPVVELGWPTHGPFVLAPHGTYYDTYLGVAMKVLDQHHPRFKAMVETLIDADALLRREIATDDYLSVPGEGDVKTPADLADLWDRALRERWSVPGGWRAFFSASGTEAVEAGLKLCYEVAYKGFLRRHGMDTFRRVQQELGIREVPYFAADPTLKDHPVFEDYPFQVVGCLGAFHGRTLGSLALTHSKRAHKLGYPKAWNAHHVAFNDPGDPLRALVDPRGIAEILAVPGELQRVVREQRRIPKDLFAGFLAETFQGEGGYVPGDPAFFAKARQVCDETGALLVVDEVQSVGRTGRLFMAERLGVKPDVVVTAKSMVIGITMARAELAAACHTGWHSNTWGSGRVFDTNFAHATLDALLHHRDPVFGGLSYFENEEVKGRMLREGFERLAKKHPKVVAGHRGFGLMNALLVRRRSEFVKTGWQMGVKLLACGWNAEVAPIRILGLADTLGREIDELLHVLDRVCSALDK
jgi:4-aminobutyrate aminotransferase-like enzyme